MRCPAIAGKERGKNDKKSTAKYHTAGAGDLGRIICRRSWRAGHMRAVDATCGRGHDTVWLVARCGRVYAFDIQPDAIASTREALQAAGIADAQILSQAQASQLAADVQDVQALPQIQADGRVHKASDRAEAPAVLPAVTLVADSHANLARYVSEPIGLIVFNLGYLPGGDKERATQAETTLASLQAALDKLTGRRAALCHHVLGGTKQAKPSVRPYCTGRRRSTAAPITACIRICAISQTARRRFFSLPAKNRGGLFPHRIAGKATGTGMRAEADTEEEEAGLCLSVLILKLPSLAYL